MQDVDIEAFLREEGFDTAGASERARRLLEQEGLTNPRKRRVARGKLPQLRRLLAERLVRVCGSAECLRAMGERAAEGAEVVIVTAPSCQFCAGSNNRRALLALGHCLSEHRVDRVLVVGGTPTQHAELTQALGGQRIAVRCVDGSVGSHSRKDAGPDLEWAQLLVIWGATPLPHKVSRLYTVDPPPHLRVVKVARRGIEALCHEVIRSFG